MLKTPNKVKYSIENTKKQDRAVFINHLVQKYPIFNAQKLAKDYKVHTSYLNLVRKKGGDTK